MLSQPKISFARLVLTLAAMLVGSAPALAATHSGSASAPHHRRHKRHHAPQPRITHPRQASASDPSGVPMPTGNLPGWQEVFSDDFTGTSLDSQWSAYWGQPGGDPGGFFDPSHVTVSGGELVISAFQDPADDLWDAGPDTYVTGGVSSSPSFAQTYGKYLVRFRMDTGQGVALAILLWPQSNTWPPEIDFAEDNGANRQTNYATLHYGAANTQVQRQVAVNMTQWHTLGVVWTKGRLVYTLDGRNWATVTNANVPSIPMVLDMQTQGWACGTSTWEQCPNATTPADVNLDVDWVVAYRQS
jgi:beta-glucanase (GH16 family)